MFLAFECFFFWGGGGGGGYTVGQRQGIKNHTQ